MGTSTKDPILDTDAGVPSLALMDLGTSMDSSLSVRDLGTETEVLSLCAGDLRMGIRSTSMDLDLGIGYGFLSPGSIDPASIE